MITPVPDPKPKQDSRRQRKQVSCYPSDHAWALLGGGASTVATAAVECWAQALADATADNAKDFAPLQWERLAGWLGDRTVHDIVYHSIRRPGVVLAMALIDANPNVVSYLDKALASQLEALDYVHVWALLWALDWRQRSQAQGEWWTLAARLEKGA